MVKCHNPGIQSLAQRYNRLCAKMEELIKTCPTPVNAVAPKLIPTKELFSLDINDSIWDATILESTRPCSNHGTRPWRGLQTVAPVALISNNLKK